jgi:RND family efflux transporter MFP subunit
VTAPFEGVITARGVDVGSLIIGDSNGANPSSTATASATTSNTSTGGTGAGLFGIARIDEVRIQISVPQTYVPALRAGSNAAVTVRELPGKVYHGTVTLRAGALDTTSRTQLVEVHLQNSNGELVPGMYAQVNVVPKHPPTTLRIPGTALIVDSNGTRVGIVTAKKTLHMQTVVIGRDFGTTVEILDGLKGNERLVNNPSDLLQDNEKVQIAAPPAGGAGGRGGRGGGSRPQPSS